MCHSQQQLLNTQPCHACVSWMDDLSARCIYICIHRRLCSYQFWRANIPWSRRIGFLGVCVKTCCSRAYLTGRTPIGCTSYDLVRSSFITLYPITISVSTKSPAPLLERHHGIHPSDSSRCHSGAGGVTCAQRSTRRLRTQG